MAKLCNSFPKIVLIDVCSMLRVVVLLKEIISSRQTPNTWTRKKGVYRRSRLDHRIL